MASGPVDILLGERKLVAWWKLDETRGANVVDLSGSGFNGALAGNPQWKPSGGKIGGALQFDGNGDHVEVASQPSSLDLTTQITVAAWIKVNKFDKKWQAIVTKGDTAWRLHRNKDNTDTMSFGCTGLRSGPYAWGAKIDGKKNVNDGRWHHVAGVYDGSRVCLYVDGALDGSEPAWGTIATNSYPVWIGGNAEKPDENYRAWDGLIDDVRIYNYALSQTELAAIYSDTKPVTVAEAALDTTP